MVTQCVFACNSLATILTIFACNMVKFVTAVLTKQKNFEQNRNARNSYGRFKQKVIRTAYTLNQSQTLDLTHVTT